jgi:hypothetical protein
MEGGAQLCDYRRGYLRGTGMLTPTNTTHTHRSTNMQQAWLSNNVKLPQGGK